MRSPGRSALSDAAGAAPAYGGSAEPYDVPAAGVSMAAPLGNADSGASSGPRSPREADSRTSSATPKGETQAREDSVQEEAESGPLAVVGREPCGTWDLPLLAMSRRRRLETRRRNGAPEAPAGHPLVELLRHLADALTCAQEATRRDPELHVAGVDDVLEDAHERVRAVLQAAHEREAL